MGKSAAVVKKAAQKLVSKRSVAKSKKPEASQFEGQPPQTCTSCSQNTQSYDKDLAPDLVFLKWTKTGKKTGLKGKEIRVAQGNECHWCFVTRRRWFEGTQAALDSARKKDKELDAQFAAMRRAKASGSKEFNHMPRKNLETRLEKKESEFNEAYRVGSFYKLKTFLRTRQLTNLEDESAAVKYITKKLHLRCGRGKDGSMGVFVYNDANPHLATYQFKEGVRSEKNLIEQTKRCDNAEDAKAEFQCSSSDSNDSGADDDNDSGKDDDAAGPDCSDAEADASGNECSDEEAGSGDDDDDHGGERSKPHRRRSSAGSSSRPNDSLTSTTLPRSRRTLWHWC